MESADGPAAFSIPVFFVLLRETLEVAIVIACLFQYMAKMDLLRHKNQVIAGVGLGLLFDFIFGAIIITLFYVAEQNAFEGDG